VPLSGFVHGDSEVRLNETPALRGAAAMPSTPSTGVSDELEAFPESVPMSFPEERNGGES
jgi:hypothetical protein